MKVLKIIVDKLPDSCTNCGFNQTKYCSLKIINKTSAFVQNYRSEIAPDRPLKKDYKQN